MQLFALRLGQGVYQLQLLVLHAVAVVDHHLLAYQDVAEARLRALRSGHGEDAALLAAMNASLCISGGLGTLVPLALYYRVARAARSAA